MIALWLADADSVAFRLLIFVSGGMSFAEGDFYGKFIKSMHFVINSIKFIHVVINSIKSIHFAKKNDVKFVQLGKEVAFKI